MFVLWALWFLSLQMAPFMFFAFDSEVPVRDAVVDGSIHATWVAAIPVVLLVAGHVLANGWSRPKWRFRWLAVAAAAALWCAILAFWILTAATD